MITNENLINELKTRPQTGNSLLVKKFYEPMVKTVSIGYKLDRLVSEVVVNDSLLKVIKNIKEYKFETETKFNNWLYTIVRNTVFDLLREKKRQRQKLNTISRDEKFISQESKAIDYLYEDLDNINNTIKFEEEDDKDNSQNEDINELLEKNDYTNFIHSYFNTTEIKPSTQMNQLVEILQEFTEDEQCYIKMRADNISMKDIAGYRKSNVVATKKYISRLMQKFCKKAAEKLNINNYKELYENFKK